MLLLVVLSGRPHKAVLFPLPEGSPIDAVTAVPSVPAGVPQGPSWLERTSNMAAPGGSHLTFLTCDAVWSTTGATCSHMTLVQLGGNLGTSLSASKPKGTDAKWH